MATCGPFTVTDGSDGGGGGTPTPDDPDSDTPTIPGIGPVTLQNRRLLLAAGVAGVIVLTR